MTDLIAFRRAQLAAMCAACVTMIGTTALASDTAKDIARYRELLSDANPAELWEARGEDIWNQPIGPKGAPLNSCDLGKGPGVVRGVYVELPRYFVDVGRVLDIEQRLVHCMVSIQGLTTDEATSQHFGEGPKRSKMEALVAYIASQSRGMAMSVRAENPQEKSMYETGERAFYYRAGAFDFSCASCHAGDGYRIRLQQLPNLTTGPDSRLAYTTWPAYRVSQGELRTLQNRIFDCFRQQRFPAVVYGSDIVTALELYMAKNALGGVYDAPNIKR